MMNSTCLAITASCFTALPLLTAACGDDAEDAGERMADKLLGLPEVESAIAETRFNIHRGGDAPDIAGAYGILVSITDSTIGTAGSGFNFATCYYAQTPDGVLRQRGPGTPIANEVVNHITGDGQSFTIFRDASTPSCNQYSIISGGRISETLLFASFLAVYAAECNGGSRSSGDYESGDMFLTDLGNGLDCPMP